jgi:Barstar (barnase inhibitor)
MTQVQLPSTTITDWSSFHRTCQQVFGFPAVYGMNMNAWIDCLTYLDLGDGMSRFHLTPGEQLVIEVLETRDLIRRVPDIVAALIESTAAVNQRYIDAGKAPMIALVFR